MNVIPGFKLNVFVLLLLGVLLSFFSSAQNDNKSDSVKSKVTALELINIPDFGNQTRNLIDDIQVLVADKKNPDVVFSEIKNVISLLNEKQVALDDTLVKLQLDQLVKEKSELLIIEERIASGNVRIEEILNQAHTYDSTALAMVEIWQVTLNSVSLTMPKNQKTGRAKEPDNLKNEISVFITDLQKSRDELLVYQDTFQILQTEITIAQNKLGNITNFVENNIKYLKRNIWVPDSPPIWQVGKDTLEVDIKKRVGEIVDAELDTITSFYNKNQKLPYYLLIILLSIFVVIIYLRIKSHDLYADYQQEFKEANVVFHNPLLSTLLIFWFSTLFFSFFPKEIRNIISMVMILPLMIMLIRLNPGRKWYSFVLFSLYFIIFLIVKKVDYNHLMQRIFLTSINVLTLVFLIIFNRNKKINIELNKFWFGALPFVNNLLIFMTFIALVTSIIGSIQLSKSLIYVVSGLIIVIFTLQTIIQMVINLVFLILMGPLMKYSFILRDDGKLVLGKINRIFRIFALYAFFYVLFEFLNIRKEVFKSVVDIVKYPLTIGEMSISLGNILAFFITIQISVWISSFLRYVLEKEAFSRMHLKDGVPNTILVLIKFSMVVLGIMFAFSAAGIKMDKLAIAIGTLGVGIGFGLQNIISNFISGIILAVDRTIKIGDLVDIPDVSGVVKDIGIRTTTVRTWDGSDVIIPNAILTSNKFTNWTFYDRLRRIKVDVRVPFDTNMEEVSKLLLATAAEIPEVMKVPKSYLNFKGIGTSAMEITLYCWIDDADSSFSYGTAIRKAVYKALIEAGYNTPVPVQDVKVITSRNTEKEDSAILG